MPKLGVDTAIHIPVELGMDMATAAPLPPTLPPTLDEIKAAFDLTVQVGAVDQRTSLFTGDLYTPDGVTSKVGSIVDHYDPTHALVQAVPAAQVAVPAADAALNGAMTLSFLGVQHYGSNRAASAWRHMHSGACFWAAVWVTGASTRVLWATANIAALANGSFLSISAIANTYRAYNATALTLNFSSVAVTNPQGVAASGAGSLLDNGTPEAYLRNNGTQISSTSTATFGIADPAAPVRVGSHLDGTLPFAGRLGFLMFMPGRPSPAQLSFLNQYLLPKYGVTV
jgi:hypothetical protein